MDESFKSIFQLRGTIIKAVWLKVTITTLYTLAVTCTHFYIVDFGANFPPYIITVCGIATGLLLVFRTNTAYDRYWEGRRLWSSLISNIRIFARCIWVYVTETEESGEIVEKLSILNLLVGFAYATKNYLREDYSYESDGVKSVMKCVPRFCNLETYNERKEGIERRIPTNIPIQLSLHLQSYVLYVYNKKVDDPLTVRLMNDVLEAMVACFTGLERILKTPLPSAYSVHLNHCVWMYVLVLPPHLVGPLGWWTLAAEGITSFALFGILAIASEIENPFGFDDNDLPLDDYCVSIRREIEIIAGHKIPPFESVLLKS